MLKANTHFFKKNFFECIKILNLSLEELRLVAKIRGIKGYKIISKINYQTYLGHWNQ